MTDKNRVLPFSNGFEFMYWREQNCDICIKDCLYNPETGQYEVKCDIEEAISLAAVGDGMIDKALAERANLPFCCIMTTCLEFIRNDTE